MKRLIRLASVIGAKDQDDKLSFGQRLMMSMGKTMMRGVTQDEIESVNSIKQSNLDWTVVREFQIVLGPSKGPYRVGHFDSNGTTSITSGDLAAFMLEELKSGKYIRQMPFVRN